MKAGRGGGASRSPAPALGRHLDTLAATVDLDARVADDPLRFPRRYRDPGDVEVAGAVAACLAFGRVSLFAPVIAACLDEADRHGGPAAYAAALAAEPARPAFAGRYYRWLDEVDLRGLFATLGRARGRRGSLAACFQAGTAAQTLEAGIDLLRHELPADASRALRSLFCRPSDGSACKRWCMYLRWMVRRGPPDLGLWTHLDPAALVIPLDTHVFRVAGFLGLADGRTPNWRAAVGLTEVLRRFDADDPVRYDFALAHLGISGACRGHRDAEVCPACPLDAICKAPASATSADASPRLPRRR
ncbi:MAG: TIGR02757 family protein [Myxococcales bacterium]|nr:TIGR02757 family protein [Myxococcales bacterium]